LNGELKSRKSHTKISKTKSLSKNEISLEKEDAKEIKLEIEKEAITTKRCKSEEVRLEFSQSTKKGKDSSKVESSEGEETSEGVEEEEESEEDEGEESEEEGESKVEKKDEEILENKEEPESKLIYTQVSSQVENQNLPRNELLYKK